MMDARRVFVSISSKSAHWLRISESTEEAIGIAVNLIKDKNIVPRMGDAKLLVEERWGSRTHVVFDMLHDAYNPETAHLPGHGNIPVIAVWLSGTEAIQVATKGLTEQVNDEVRDAHRKFGDGSKPPFFIDHSDGKVPLFVNPRTVNSDSEDKHPCTYPSTSTRSPNFTVV